MKTIDRVVFNFSDRCNLSCAYCFVPFRRGPVIRDKVLATFASILALKPRYLVIGGGEPSMYAFLPEMLQQARASGAQVQLDTNGFGIQPTLNEVLKSCVDLISLPLDGATPDECRRMRGKGGDEGFHVTLRLIRELTGLGIAVKVNTLVSRQNAQSIHAIAAVLRATPPTLWSLYQYMAIEAPAQIVEYYALSEADYAVVVKSLEGLALPFSIKPATGASRTGNCLFVSSSGEVYTHDPSKPSRFAWPGMISDPTTLDRFWKLHQSTIRPEIEERFRDLAAKR